MQQSKPKLNKGSQKTSGKSNVRIIGGSMRGRKIAFSAGEGLRPTLDRVRETLFNWLARDIAGSICLDLFAGSGALGFEAISRGASHLYMVDSSDKVCNSLNKNASQIGINNITIKNRKALQFLSENNTKFDIVFLDPPFGKELLWESLEKLIPHLSDDAMVYIEQEKNSQQQPNERWQVLKSKQTSNFSYQLICLDKKSI